jgi:hypothetical protein
VTLAPRCPAAAIRASMVWRGTLDSTNTVGTPRSAMRPATRSTSAVVASAAVEMPWMPSTSRP